MNYSDESLKAKRMSNSKSEDTSLDDIFDNHGQVVGYGDYYQTEVLADIKIEIMAWHKAEIAKTLASIKKDIERVLWGMSLISIEDGRSEHYATGYNKALDDVRKALEEYIK